MSMMQELLWCALDTTHLQCPHMYHGLKLCAGCMAGAKQQVSQWISLRCLESRSQWSRVCKVSWKSLKGLLKPTMEDLFNIQAMIILSNMTSSQAVSFTQSCSANGSAASCVKQVTRDIFRTMAIASNRLHDIHTWFVFSNDLKLLTHWIACGTTNIHKETYPPLHKYMHFMV